MTRFERAPDLPGWAAGILLLAGTVAVAGVTDSLLTRAGYETLGAVVWLVCYAAALATIWLVWLRHVDLTGAAEG